MAATPLTIALEKWHWANGGFTHSKLRIAQDNEKGIHWSATGRIDPESIVLRVSYSISLSYLNGLVDDSFPIFRQRRDAFKIEAIGFFYLMSQYINRSRSFWKPYLDTLPSPEEGFTQPLWFEDAEDIAWLEGTDVWHAAEERRKVYQKYYGNGVSVLKEGGIDIEPYTWHLFKWAVTMFSSRSFTSRSLQPDNNAHWTTYATDLEGRRRPVILDLSHVPAEDLNFPVLFPVMDASNHRYDAHVEWQFGDAGFSVTTLDRADANCEVFNNYGAKSNDELFLGYGFCIPHNPYDTVLVTLKAPPHGLQDDLRPTHPHYFTSESEWDSDKATFRLPLLQQSATDEPPSIFSRLPKALLELLLYILRHERGLQFEFIADTADYSNSLEFPGRRYLPHIARMLVQSLIPKLNRLPSSNEPAENLRQTYARFYTANQRLILTTYIAQLRAFTRSLLLLPAEVPRTLASAQPNSPHLLPVESLHALIFPPHTTTYPSVFLQGLTASAGSSDLIQLREAGWEDDIFVLLLCWAYLSNNTLLAPERLPEHVRSPHRSNSAGGHSDDVDNVEEDELLAAAQTLPVVHAAAEAFPQSVWADERWTPRLIAAVGGRMLRWESFTVMCPIIGGDGAEEEGPPGLGEGEQDQRAEQGEEPRLCVYL